MRLKDTCSNRSFQRERKQSLCKMKGAPKKPVLKPFQEQKSPTGHGQRAGAAPWHDYWRDGVHSIQRKEQRRGGAGFGTSLWWLVLQNKQRSEQRVFSMTYSLNIQLQHWQRFCRRRRNYTSEDAASIQTQLRAPVTSFLIQDGTGLSENDQAWVQIKSGMGQRKTIEVGWGEVSPPPRTHTKTDSIMDISSALLYFSSFYIFKFYQEVLNCWTG